MKTHELPGKRTFDLQRLKRPIRKRSILTFLFIGYFFSYAVSPLSYDISEGHGSDQLGCTAEAATLSSRSMRIFLWELIGAKLSVEKHIPMSRSAVKILLRKVRAVMPHSVVEGSALAAKTAVDDGIYHVLFSLSVAVPKDSPAATGQVGFRQFCRGRPPPLGA